MNNDREITPVVILSGGMELSSVALFEEFKENRIPTIVISLVNDSLLKTYVSKECYFELDWPPKAESKAIESIMNFIIKLKYKYPCKTPWPIFATEDAGLRLLMSNLNKLSHLLIFSHATKIKMSGLDKSEFFTFLNDMNLSNIIVDTITVKSSDDAIQKYYKHNSITNKKYIFKPSLKHYSMSQKGMKSKVISTELFDTKSKLESALKNSFDISNEWIMQPKQNAPKSGELVWWGIRDQVGNCDGIVARALLKHPKMGGTGCVVELLNEDILELSAKAKMILDAIDFTGLVEIEFIPDRHGVWRVLEINPRPWLQISATSTSNIRIVTMAYNILKGEKLKSISVRENHIWVNIERLFVGAISGSFGNRTLALINSILILIRSDDRAIYSSKLPRIKFKWLKKLLKKGLE